MIDDDAGAFDAWFRTRRPAKHRPRPATAAADGGLDRMLRSESAPLLSRREASPRRCPQPAATAATGLAPATAAGLLGPSGRIMIGEADRARAMYAWGVSAPEAKVAEIRAIAREGGSGIAAWRTMLQREATGATARATTAPMGASRASRWARLQSSAASGAGRPQTAGNADAWGRHQSAENQSSQRMQRSLSRFSLEPPRRTQLDASTLERIAAFERTHRAAGTQGLVAVDAARHAGHMDASHDASCLPSFDDAIATLRRNRLLILPRTGHGGSGERDVPSRAPDDQGPLTTLEEGGGGEGGDAPGWGEALPPNEVEDGDRPESRLLGCLLPLLVAEEPGAKAAELRHCKDVLREEQALLTQAFDFYRSQPGLAVALADGGMATTEGQAKQAVDESRPPSDPEEAWIMDGSGACLCRAQWWHLLRDSPGLLGNGLTCSDVDFLFEEAMSRSGTEGALLEVEAGSYAPSGGGDTSPSNRRVGLDPHAPLATINLAGFVVALAHLAHTKARLANEAPAPLGVQLRKLLHGHVEPALGGASRLDALSRELRRPPFTSLLARHLPILRRCWKYWNTQHGEALSRGSRQTAAALTSPFAIKDDAAARRDGKEVWLMDSGGDTADLLSSEDRFNYNEMIIMLRETGMFRGGALKVSDVPDIFEAATGDRPRLADVHAANARDELIFDEFVELLVRIAVHRDRGGAGGRWMRRPEVSDTAALVSLADDFLRDYYNATDRFYPGGLARIVRKELDDGPPGEPATRRVHAPSGAMRSGPPHSSLSVATGPPPSPVRVPMAATSPVILRSPPTQRQPAKPRKPLDARALRRKLDAIR